MASGSSKGFDFASDDILCSYEDYTNQETSNGSHSDSAIATNSAKEFHKNRMARTSVFPASSYNPPDDSGSQEVIISAVEKSIKKYNDNIMRFLEGLSSRLSQLELYCYNLDKSIGEMRSDLTRDHGESDAKLKFLEKHLQEVHRSVQILRDKQELADTQKELAKLQLVRKESSSSHNSQQNEERSSTPDTKKNDNSGDLHNQQLALALPSQVAPPPQPQMAPPPQPQVTVTQPQSYYLPPPPQQNQTQYVLPQAPQQAQYQQQWAPQVQPQGPSMQTGSRPSSPQVYQPYLQTQLGQLSQPPPYLPSQPGQVSQPGHQPSQPGPEPVQNNTPMHNPYSGSSQPMTYNYGPVRTEQVQPPPQNIKPGQLSQPGDGYAPAGPPQGNTYMMYDSEPTRVQQHPNQTGHFQQSGYSPNPQQGTINSNMMSRPPQYMQNHPYNELIDKLVSMGYRGDHVINVIQRLDETGQTVDFNAVLDRLNGHSSGGGPQRGGWSR